MSKINVVRAWKDAKFRNSLTAEEQAAIPANPAGLVELSDAQLGASGAAAPESYICSITCTWDSHCPSAWCPLSITCKPALHA